MIYSIILCPCLNKENEKQQIKTAAIFKFKKYQEVDTVELFIRQKKQKQVV